MPKRRFHYKKTRDYPSSSKTMLTIALMATFSAMSAPAFSQVTITGTVNKDYTITNDANGLPTSVVISGSLNNPMPVTLLPYDSASSKVTIQSLINTGTIIATNGGIPNRPNIGMYIGNVVGTLDNSGIISATSLAIQVEKSITYLTNSGTISSKLYGIINDSTITNLDNSGVLSSVKTAIKNYAVIGTLTNSGTIAGGAFALINSGSVAIVNAGVIAGNIQNNTSGDLDIVGGTDSTFGTLTGYNDTIGTLTNTASNVVFGSGNILLNDNINLGNTSYALNNTGAVLQVNNPVTISGNYNQNAAATLLIGVADSAVSQGSSSADIGYGRLIVSGSAVIAPGSSVTLQKLNSYGFAVGQRFVVVDANAVGTNYNEGSLIYGLKGITGAVLSGKAVLTGTTSDLVVTVESVTTVSTNDSTAGGGESTTGDTTTANSVPDNTTLTSTTEATPTKTPATTRNAIGLLKGLAAYSGYSEDALLNLYNAAQALNNGTAEVANKAGAQLGPVAQTRSIRVAALPTFDALDVIGARVDALRLAQVGGNRGSADSGTTFEERAALTGVWGQAFGGHASQNARDEVNGYTANYAGILLGVDKAINDQWRAGGAFSYSNAAMYSTGSSTGDATHIDNYGFFGYASYTAPRWYVNLSAGVASQHYNENRAIDFTGYSGTANGSFGGTQWVARGELGYPLGLGAATLTPLASLTYAYLHQNGYTESSGDGAALRVGTAHATSVKTDIGAKLNQAFSTRYGVLVPSVQLAWRHEYAHSKTTVDASFADDPIAAETAFSTQGARPISDSALLTAGITVLRANNLSITAQYQVQASPGFLSQAGTLRLRQLF